MRLDNWFGTLPTDWEARRLKYAAPLQTKRAEISSTSPDYIGLENIESWTGKLLRAEVQPEAQADGQQEPENVGSSTSAFQPGDVLFGKLRPYLAKALIAPTAGGCSTELLVLRPSEAVHGRYLQYALLTPALIGLVDSTAFGAKMPRADWNTIGNVKVPLPSLSQQKRIAAHLDAETARIDALIADKQRMLALLDEKRQALISQAVTQGLNPDALVKPSGQEWLGNIPAHWKLLRAKWLFRERDQRSVTGEEEMLTVSHITGVTPRSEKNVNMFEAEDNTGYKLCYRGDLVVNTLWAWMGAMGIAQQGGMTSPNYHVYTPSGGLLPEYIELFCRMPHFIAEVTSRSTGVWSSRLRLYPEEFLDITMAVPPHDEQRAIIQSVEHESGAFRRLKDELFRSITLLQERRSAVVSAAVTGELNLGGGSP